MIHENIFRDEIGDTPAYLDRRKIKTEEQRLRDEAARRVSEASPVIHDGFTPVASDCPVDGGCGGE